MTLNEMKNAFLTILDHIPDHIMHLSDNIGQKNEAFIHIFIPKSVVSTPCGGMAALKPNADLLRLSLLASQHCLCR